MERFSIFCLLLTALSMPETTTLAKKTCYGTSSKLSVGVDRMDHLVKMYKRYQNCTTVEGNLEITGLESTNIDVSFLKDIEVVTGYVIIALNYVPYIPLEKLRLIRGRELYKGFYALYISVNYNIEDRNQRLEILGLKSLTEISQGAVLIDNNRLCYVNTIDWNDIITLPRQDKVWNATVINEPPPACEACDEICNGHCWGAGRFMCQTLTQRNCNSVCDKKARCRGTSPEDCCVLECSGGCTGPTARDCMVCRHVNDSGICKNACPPARIYDSQTSRLIENPDFKYHYSDTCVDECPSNLLVQDNSCVKSCTIGWHNDGTGKCVRCANGFCEKECFGVNHPDGFLSKHETVHSLNIHNYEGCNIIRGNLIFQSYAFSGDSIEKIPPMNISQLQALKDIRNITGYLAIFSWHKNLSDFSIFENLEQITGVEVFKNVVSLAIRGGDEYLNQITSLGFRSLKVISHGNVYIASMKNLCYENTVNWTMIVKNPKPHKQFDKNGVRLQDNKSSKTCNVICDKQCSDQGCWGHGPGQCLTCKNYYHNGTCVEQCPHELGLYSIAGVRSCQSCDPACVTCIGEGPENCTQCKNFENDGECVPVCPVDKYPDPDSNECYPCNSTCLFREGRRLCKGPNSTIDENGCNFCDYVLMSKNLNILRCLPSNSSCPVGHFTSSKTASAANYACIPCYEGCRNCSGIEMSDCNHPLPMSASTKIALAVSFPIAVIILALLIMFYCRSRRLAKEKLRDQSLFKLGLDPLTDEQSTDPRARLMEPMTPSGVAPNKAQLRVVKEAELKIGKILGSGAFGTVHKGYWIPDLAPREKVKVPVAIKVLRDESSQVASNEILDEAFVMASCEHPNLVRLLGVCLSQRIMLISQLMPLGNLLEYVRENQDNITSQHLLNWSLQIAKGMCFLAEEKHLVHRDLAARNVLVKSPNQVRITDFGLAKLLDVNEDAYRAEGGKMPIKWLALESIQHRIFTQKSDVWSFGVTMWELLTFGKRPYENIPAREVLSLLELGQRLPQPSICTIDIYMMLIKCWTVDVEARPTFRELTEELSKMARDPPRYIVIQNEKDLNALPNPTTSEFLRTLMNEEGDEFTIADAEDYLHFPTYNEPENEQTNPLSLHPAPATARWKRQHSEALSSTSSQKPLLGDSHRKKASKNSEWRNGQSRAKMDGRLDSVLTTTTTLSDFSLSNGNNDVVTPSILPSIPDVNEVVFGNNELPMHDFQKFSKIPNHSANNRSSSDSSDVFSTSSLKRPGIDSTARNGFPNLEQPTTRINRKREDSTTLRYSAEPIALNRQKQQAKLNEYLDPGEASNLLIEENCSQPIDFHTSSVSNPDYDCTFTPKENKNDHINGYLHSTGKDSIDLNVYENLLPKINEDNESKSCTLGRNSQCSDECDSEKRDSGMQSDNDCENRKNAVSNPNYESLENAETPVRDTRLNSEYVNITVESPKFGFGADDIFNINKRHVPSVAKDGRTYSEPDSGVGIDVAVDNLLYHRLPCTNHERIE